MTKARSRDRRQPRSTAIRPPRAFRRATLIVLTGAIVYSNGLSSPFLWDDRVAIVDNDSIRHIGEPWRALSPPLESPVSGRPIANLTFALNYAAGGLDPFGYHVINVAIHVTCALLLFGIVRRTVTRARPTWPADVIGAVAAVLWEVHPLTTDAVDYVTQRTESLMALLFLLTLYAAIRARGTRPTLWTIVAALSAALGMATKQTMVVAPIVIILYDRVFEFDSITRAARARWPLYVALSVTWIELILLMWAAPRSTVGSSASIGSWTYLLNQAQLIRRYLLLAFWPGPLVLDYGLPRLLGFADVAADLILLVLLAIATLIALRKRPPIGFLGAFAFLTLAPTSSILPILSEAGAERRMYLPLMAIVVLVVCAGYDICLRLTSKVARPARVFRFALAAALASAAALGVRTSARNAQYATPLYLWESSVEHWPHGRVRMGYAIELMTASRYQEAIVQLREAVKDFPDARSPLGSALLIDNQVDEAIRELTMFIEANPTKPDRTLTRLLLGRGYLLQGKPDDATKQYQVILQQFPDHQGAREGLTMAAGVYLTQAEAVLRENRFNVAESLARSSLALNATDEKAHNILGVALVSQGRVNEAIAAFHEALRLNPADGQAQRNLARALTIVP